MNGDVMDGNNGDDQAKRNAELIHGVKFNDPRAAEARRLREVEGFSLAQIQERLHVGNDRLTRWLKGTTPPEWTKRPRAKDDLREQARELRAEGRTYGEITELLGVSKSSVSLWVRDVPKTNVPPRWQSPRGQILLATRRAEREVDWQSERSERRAEFAEVCGELRGDGLINAGAIAYWCEGSKSKPWRKTNSVVFANMDPGLIRLFLRFIEVVPVNHGGPTFRLSIHESGDEPRAKRYWCRELGIELADFTATNWKRHNPKTVRKNTEETYHGCLFVRVRQGAELYWYIDDLVKTLLPAMPSARSSAV